jgi:hypothetical protein
VKLAEEVIFVLNCPKVFPAFVVLKSENLAQSWEFQVIPLSLKLTDSSLNLLEFMLKELPILDPKANPEAEDPFSVTKGPQLACAAASPALAKVKSSVIKILSTSKASVFEVVEGSAAA